MSRRPTPAIARRARAAVVALVALAAAAAACVGERERLSPPRLILVLDDTVVQPGDVVTGRAIGVDEHSGLTNIAVRARTGDSSYVQQVNLFTTDSFDFAFALHVPLGAPHGALVVITASAINEQLLSRTAVDTARVVRP